MADQYDQTPAPVESTGRGLFGFGGKKKEEVQSDNAFSSESAEKVHVSEVEPKKESGGGILGMFGFGGKKKEDVPSENEFSSEAPETVQASEVEHESTGRGLIGTKEEGVKPGSAFSSEPSEKVHFSEDVEPKHPSDTGSVESTDRGLFGIGGKKAEEVHTENTFSSESDEKVHFSEDVEPKNESLAEKMHPSNTGSLESTDRGLFGFGGKKAEEVQTENTFNSESDEKVHFSEDVEPKHESLAEKLHPSATGSVESTDRGLFGFGGKKAEEVRSGNTFSSESDENVHVSEDVEPKHESLLEQMHRSDQERTDERTSDRNAFSSEYEQKVPVSDVEPYHTGESTDRGLFGSGGKKKEEVDSENAFNSKFEQKVQVSETEPKKESLLHKLHRSDSYSSSSSDEEEVEEGGVKKKKLKEKIKDKIKGTDKGTEEVNKYHEEETSLPSYNEVPLPVHQVQPEEKKGLMERMKDKLPGHKKNDEFTPTPAVVAPPPAAVDHGPSTPTEEKKGFLSKIKDKLHHSKTDEEKEIEKEKNQY